MGDYFVCWFSFLFLGRIDFDRKNLVVSIDEPTFSPKYLFCCVVGRIDFDRIDFD